MLVKAQAANLQLDLEEIMKYQLTPVPYCIGTADGFLAKTDKSKALQHVTKDCVNSDVLPIKETLTVIDGNAIFHMMKDIPPNFSQVSTKVFSMMPKKGDVVFSTDNYKEDSVTSMERRRRGWGEKLITEGENTKRPRHWKLFLCYDENKIQFTNVLVDVWRKDATASGLKDRKVILICEGKAHEFTSQDGKTTDSREAHEFRSDQEETDTRALLYCWKVKEDYQNIRINTPASDIFFIGLHFAEQFTGVNLLFDTGTGNKKG